jgi:hypothetical protein
MHDPVVTVVRGVDLVVAATSPRTAEIELHTDELPEMPTKQELLDPDQPLWNS